MLSNNYMSPPFSNSQGTCQGCPLFPLLFTIAIEPLAITLRDSDMFQGISVGNQNIKLSMFADYMLLFISDPLHSLASIISTLDHFSSFAGLRVNYSKSNLLPLSRDQSYFTSHHALTKFALCKSQLKYFGVYIPHNLNVLYQINIKPIMQSIEKSLTEWKGLPLLLSSRVVVIKSILFSKLSYVLQMILILPSRSDIGLLRKSFLVFLWQGKRPRITYTKLTLPRSDGGYGLPDILTFSQSALFRHVSN